jgi:hypothetical protein
LPILRTRRSPHITISHLASSHGFLLRDSSAFASLFHSKCLLVSTGISVHVIPVLSRRQRFGVVKRSLTSSNILVRTFAVPTLSTLRCTTGHAAAKQTGKLREEIRLLILQGLLLRHDLRLGLRLFLLGAVHRALIAVSVDRANAVLAIAARVSSITGSHLVVRHQ